jgi:hypothetical protein
LSSDFKTDILKFIDKMEDFKSMPAATLQFMDFESFYDMYKSFIASLEYRMLSQRFRLIGYADSASSAKSLRVLELSIAFFASKVKLEEWRATN